MKQARPPCAWLLAGLALAFPGVAAQAQPGNTQTYSGTIAAEVVDPGAVVKVQDLRFGAFPSPAGNATMTITPNGAVSATGDLATTMNLFSSPADRGPALFRIQGNNNRAFLPFMPRSMTISNGTSTMQIDRMDDNVFGIGLLDRDGRYNYEIGGRLRVGANQAPGKYTGEFEITVLFL